MIPPRVSIIVPMFNAEKYLDETIQGVLNQTFQDWELLLVDDGSTDGSVTIAKRYTACYSNKIRYLEHPGHENRRQFATRILGARHARADVLALLDADDVWDRDYLKKHLQLWDAVQPHNVVLSYGPSLYWFPDDPSGSKDFVQPMPPGAPKVYPPGELLNSFWSTHYANTPCPSCTLIRREVFDELQQFEKAGRDSLAFEDQILCWYVAARWPVAVHRNVWVRYRRHNTSSVGTTASSKQAGRAELSFLRAIREDLSEVFPDHPLVKNSALSERINSLTIQRSPMAVKTLPHHLLNGVRRIVPRPAKRFAKRLMRLMNMVRSRARLTLGVHPLSYLWGLDRGTPICLYYLEQFLQECVSDIRGHCLEFQENSYTTRFGGAAVTKVDILHIDDSNPLATLIADLTKANDLPSNRFDCIICTHVLHVILELDRAVSELYRILKPGGVLLVAVPHVSMCDPEWHEIWRFTPEGLSSVLAKAFGAENVTVCAYGNSLTAAGQIRGLAAHEFTKAELDDRHDLRFAVEVCARARKQS